jgi:hypothetical protein
VDCKEDLIHLATVVIDPVLENSWFKAARNQFISDRLFSRILNDTASKKAMPPSDPKDGVHVHWLLAHCAVFKERARSARVPPQVRCRTFAVDSTARVGFRASVARGLMTHLPSEGLFDLKPLEPSVR